MADGFCSAAETHVKDREFIQAVNAAATACVATEVSHSGLPWLLRGAATISIPFGGLLALHIGCHHRELKRPSGS